MYHPMIVVKAKKSRQTARKITPALPKVWLKAVCVISTD